MIIENQIKISKIILIIGCFAYSYHLKSIYGFVFFSMATITWAITSYNEGEKFNNTIINIVIFTYILGMISGSMFMIDVSKDPNEYTKLGVFIIMISAIILFFSIYNIFNLFIMGKSNFVELNQKVLRSNHSIEQEDEKRNLDVFVDKYKNKK